MKDQYSVFINAGAVVLLANDMLEQERRDVLSSVLFAQLVANKKYPALSQPGEWYGAYREVLQNGWLQRAVAWDRFTLNASEKCNIIAWVEKQLEAHVDRTIVTDVTRLLNRVAQLSCTLPAIDLLREHVQGPRQPEPAKTTVERGYRVRLQVILAQPGPVLNSVCVDFEAGQVTSNPLGALFSTDQVLGNIQLRCFQANLSDALYAPLRDAIVKKLGGKATENIFDISDAVEHQVSRAVCL
ncbi:MULTISPECIES: hypothetical protein [Pseudomonas]|uniref:Uncharacterized protein n=1 Tax=Pseudomonas viciae TaxID=2505979 RepID=A0ABY8PFU0_9PSED|nr:hypothetical protein [Pseudomonas viciae]WGO94072.1 hypothetical protein QCD61_03045 [Pseudomonas viciae]